MSTGLDFYYVCTTFPILPFVEWIGIILHSRQMIFIWIAFADLSAVRRLMSGDLTVSPGNPSASGIGSGGHHYHRSNNGRRQPNGSTGSSGRRSASASAHLQSHSQLGGGGGNTNGYGHLTADTCPSCRMPFDKGRKRKLVDTCGHERCYSCMFRNEACPICLATGM